MINQATAEPCVTKGRDHLPQTPLATFCSSARTQITASFRQIEAYVREHPVTGISAAFCLGGFVGWIIKRR